jgi:hypothetical protein
VELLGIDIYVQAKMLFSVTAAHVVVVGYDIKGEFYETSR